MGLRIQFSANLHRTVPPHEEAIAISQLYDLTLIEAPDYSMGRFAREIGKNRETVERALQYAKLPPVVRQFVETRPGKHKKQASSKDDLQLPRLRYGIAVELYKIWELDQDERTIIRWVEKALLKRYSVPDFRAIVKDHLDYVNSGQISLFGENADEDRAEHERWRRRVVREDLINALWYYRQYFSTVALLFRTGQLGLEDSPFSDRSFLRLFQEVLSIMEEVGSHVLLLRKNVPRKKLQRVITTRKSAEALEQLLFPEEDTPS